MRSSKELLTLPSVEAHFGNSAVGAKIPGNHVPLEYMAIPSLLSRSEVRKYHFNFASQYRLNTLQVENRSIGYTGDGIAEKPNWRR